MNTTLQDHLNREIRKAKAEALREAAAEFAATTRIMGTGAIELELLARADRIEGRLDVTV